MNNTYIVAVDIGTSKVLAMAAEKIHGLVQITACSEVPSRGVARGEVMNITRTGEDISKAIQKLKEHIQTETGAAPRIQDVYVNVTGMSLRHSTGSLEKNRRDPSRPITQEEIDDMLTEMFAQKTSAGEIIMDVIPQHYDIGDFQGVGTDEAVGMTGDHIYGQYALFYGKESTLNNCKNALKAAQLRPAQEIMTAKALTYLLSDMEKELGCVIIDIGSGTTKVVVIENNIIRMATIIPFGGNSITSDIRSECVVATSFAEKMKVQHGACISEYAQENKVIAITDPLGVQTGTVSLKLMHSVIEARVCEILATVRQILDKEGLWDSIRSDVVITGGVARTNFITALAAHIFNRNVRLGLPNSQIIAGSSTDAAFRPEASTAVGLILEGMEDTATRQFSDSPRETLFDDIPHAEETPAAGTDSGSAGSTSASTQTVSTDADRITHITRKKIKTTFSDRVWNLFSSTNDPNDEDNEA